MKYNRGQQRIVNYSEAIRLFWKRLYVRGGRTLYSRQKFQVQKPSWVNIEHVFPMAWVVNFLGCYDRSDCRRRSSEFNFIEADLHNLYPARRELNTIRASHRFGHVPGEAREYGIYDFEINHKARIIEPPTESQGEIARAMFYMADAYNLEIYGEQSKILKNWNRIDPPSPEELRRNGLIEQLQGNRNHFIDYPKDIDFL